MKKLNDTVCSNKHLICWRQDCTKWNDANKNWHTFRFNLSRVSMCTDSCQGEILIQVFNIPPQKCHFFFNVSNIRQFWYYPQMFTYADFTPTFLRTKSLPSLNHSFLKRHAFINDINKPHKWTKSLYLFWLFFS